MKKNILLGGMLLCAAAFTSCNEDFDNWASPQSNQQGDPTEAYELTVSAGPQANVVMDNAGETANIVIASYAVDNLKSIQLKSMTIEGHSLPYTYEGGAVSVKTAQLDSLIEAVTLDRSATPHKVTVKTEWAVNLLSGEAVPASAETMVTLTPFSNTPEIDPKGYAMLGQWQGWNPGNPTWMTEVEPGVYQALVTTTDDGDNWYKFYKGSGFDEANFPWDAVAMGCVDNGDATSPNLLVWGDDPRFGGFQTPVISGAGQWLVTLDMNKLYYKVEPKETRYYVVGVPNGWSTSDMSCMFYALGGNKYIYTTRWPNQWSLKIWDIDHFGDWSACYGSVVDGSTDAKGSLINSNSQAFGPDANGAWATLTINMGTKEYEWTIIDTPATEYTAVSIIGAFNDWSADTEINMTQLENSPHNWYTRATFTTNTELKFRANHDWGVNWGGDGSAEINEDKYYVAPGGENIKVAAGTYDFYLNDITGNWSIAKVAE